MKKSCKEKFKNKEILDMIKLSNGWILLKTEDSKSPKDFLVITVHQINPLKYYTPKHAHFAIDFYGKLCADKDKALKVFNAIIKIWQGKPIEKILEKYEDNVKELPGYPLEYILYALRWIFEQEDINFKGRSQDMQRKIDEVLSKLNIETPPNKKGSELAIFLLFNLSLIHI